MVRRRFCDIHIQPTGILQTIYLCSDNTSWLKFYKSVPGLDMDEFEKLWSEKPLKRATRMIGGKIIECPRYTKSYLLPYSFSGEKYGGHASCSNKDF